MSVINNGIILYSNGICLLQAYEKQVNPWDYSDIVTGLLLAPNCLLQATTCGFMKPTGVEYLPYSLQDMVFGGLGKNFINPEALAARVFLFISFPGRMSAFALEKIASPTTKELLSRTRCIGD